MTTSPNKSASALQQIDTIEQKIALLRRKQNVLQARVKKLLYQEAPDCGVFFHEEIFRLQQDKLRLETEIQFQEVALRRLKSTW